MEVILNRIAELNKIIMDSHKMGAGVQEAIIWADAIKERSELQNSLRSQNIDAHVNVNK